MEISENQWRGKGNISKGEGINFYGNDGSLEISLSGKFNAYFKDGQEIKENYIPDYNKIWKEFHHSFVKSILEDSPIPITGEEATKNLAVILAILKSSEKNRSFIIYTSRIQTNLFCIWPNSLLSNLILFFL